MLTPAQAPAVLRLTYLRIKNYRALRDVEFRDLTPLTVLIGPNGSGKSTVLDALDFLAEAVRGNLVGAWEKRNRFQGMRTRGSEGNIEFELEIGKTLSFNALRYFISVNEVDNKVVVISEKLIEKDKRGETNLSFLAGEELPYDEASGLPEYKYTAAVVHNKKSIKKKPKMIKGFNISAVVSMIFNGDKDKSRVSSLLDADNPMSGHAAYFIEILDSYRYVHLTDDHLKGFSDAGPREKLSPNGDNLPNVLYYLHTKHPETLAKITAQMRRWVPGLVDIVTEITSDERLLLRFRDAPFEKPLPAQYMSDGTMRLAALLTLLYEPDAAGLLGLEEPENELHPQLLAYLAEELIAATETRQLLVATHSPALLNALAPEQVWVLHKGTDGYTRVTRTDELPGIAAMVEEGTPLGYLWSRNFFDVGNPLDFPTPAQ
ncbi:AAA family ATPase [Hymenobacter sp. M29]|uniref:AAA family ATPase n=1 Tax=Hymenobacter mellowenesis TaxID=3063995 RepID=A0ABT9AF09_9BACT|nr:AAA family ATPase [Hymenobacter sp. M29]MDO7848444.1 AAA family ATPase [Hymenobacter sp. M29]